MTMKTNTKLEKKMEKPSKISKKDATNILVSEKHRSLLVLNITRFVRLVMKRKSDAIKHLPDKENLICMICKKCLIITALLLKYKKLRITFYTQEFLLKNNWMTFLDKLSTLEITNQNTLPILLYKILVPELISKEKEYKPFWTPACKELSEKLLLPIKIDCPVSDSIYFNPLLKKREEKSQLLKIIPINLQKKNLRKTYYQSSISSHADKWVKENTEETVMKTVQIPLLLSKYQRTIIDEWFDTARYVYNKTVNEIYVKKTKDNYMAVKNRLVIDNTYTLSESYKILNNNKFKLKKELNENKNISIKEEETIKEKIKENEIEIKKLNKEKNTNIKEWELNTPKDIRLEQVKDVFDALKTGFSNLKNGKIRHFRLKYKKKKEYNKCIKISKNAITNKDGIFNIYPTYFKKENEKNIRIGKRNKKKYKNFEILYDFEIAKKNKEYILLIPVQENITKKRKIENYCGIDPGVRTFMTTFGNQGCYEYEHNKELLKKIHKKIKDMKDKRNGKKHKRKHRNSVRKKSLIKQEKRKSNLINELHWKVIIDIIKKNDIIYYGDIKSHDIVRNNKNRTLNRDTNDLKFYKFKEKLQYKCKQQNKLLFIISEPYTTKTCSFCGNIYNPGNSKIYNCSFCKNIMGRDLNAAKNILIKGICSHS